MGLAGVLGGLNVLREWVKDVQDMEGDLAARHRTMAIALRLQNRWGLACRLPVGCRNGIDASGSRARTVACG